jgi:hypothetical protein
MGMKTPKGINQQLTGAVIGGLFIGAFLFHHFLSLSDDDAPLTSADATGVPREAQIVATDRPPLASRPASAQARSDANKAPSAEPYVSLEQYNIDRELRDLQDENRPRWNRLVRGQQALLATDGYDKSRSVVCASLASALNAAENGLSSEPRCTFHAVGESVVFHSVTPLHFPGRTVATFDYYALVSAANDSWQGYVTTSQLKPIVPLPLDIKTVQQGYLAPMNQPHIHPTQFQHVTVATALNFPGKQIGEVPVRLLRYSPIEPYDANTIVFNAYVQILGGGYTGESGWIEDGYLATKDGYSIGCFCASVGFKYSTTLPAR